MLKLQPQAQHTALQAARRQQQTTAFKDRYKKRAGVEGTISQAVRTFQLRRSRYVGLAKTHFQNIAIAAAINITRLADWLNEVPTAKTRQSRFATLESCLT